MSTEKSDHDKERLLLNSNDLDQIGELNTQVKFY